MLGAGVGPLPDVTLRQVASARDEHCRHRPLSSPAGEVCRACGRPFPCEPRQELLRWFAWAGYKPEPKPIDKRLLLADELYLIGHKSVDGNARRSARTISLGLSAALLAEGMLSGVIAITSAGTLEVVAASPPGTIIADVLTDIRREQHPLPTWIEYVGQKATAVVANRLEAAGHLARTRRLIGGLRWVPTNMGAADWRLLRLKTLCDERSVAEPPDLLLIGLVIAIGLGDEVFAGLDDRAVQYTEAEMARLPEKYKTLTTKLTVVCGEAALRRRL